MHNARRLGLNHYSLYFGILFVLAIFSLSLMTTALNFHQHQAIAQTLKNTTNNNPSVSSAASPSTTKASKVSKSAPATNSYANTTTTNVASTAATTKDHRPIVSNITLPFNVTKPIRVEFNGSDPDKNDTLTFYIVHPPLTGSSAMSPGIQ